MKLDKKQDIYLEGFLNNNKQGVVINKTLFKQESNLNYVEDEYKFTNKIYFEDSCVVFELSGLNIYHDERNQTTYQHYIIGYIFHDITTHSYYTYNTFSDTAFLEKEFIQPDTVVLDGTWNFKFGFRPTLSETLDFSEIRDTLFIDDNPGFKREKKCKVIYATHKIPTGEDRGTILYLETDSIPAFITYDHALSNKYKLPVTRVDMPSFGSVNGFTHISTRINLERGYLTEAEKKVFDVWAEYARNHPLE